MFKLLPMITFITSLRLCMSILGRLLRNLHMLIKKFNKSLCRDSVEMAMCE